MDLVSYLLLGLATSLHCVAMCGTLVMTYSAKTAAGTGLSGRLVPHLAYHTAKVASYMAVAAVLGGIAAAVGSAIDISAVRSWVMVLAGAAMVLLGLSMTGYLPWLHRLTPRPPEWLTGLVARTRRRAARDASAGSSSLATPIAFGLLGGLMPCAPLIAAQAGAMAEADPLKGSLLMLAFGIGTAPLMIVLGLVAGSVSAAFRERMQLVAAAAVIIVGLIVAGRGLTLIGVPVSIDRVAEAPSAGTSGAGVTRDADGRARFDLVIENTRFVPATVILPAGEPVTLVVDRREDSGCSAQLAIPKLGVLEDLEAFATTTIEIPATAAGEYVLTCGMGMMSGRIVFEDAPAE